MTMLRATLRGMAGRKARLALTSLAVVLGSAFIAAALVLTASIESTVNELNQDEYAGSDVIVEPVEPQTQGERMVRDGVTAESLEAVEAVDGVAETSVTVSWMINAIGSDGKIVGGFAPTLAVNWGDESAHRELREGRGPTADDEVAVSAQFEADSGLGVGDEVIAYSPTSDEVAYQIVGLYGYSGGRDSTGGSTELAFTTTTAQELVFDGQDVFTAIAVKADSDTGAAELRDALDGVIGGEALALTQTEYTEEANAETAETAETMSIIGNFLLGFGAIAVFVSVFLIANTFSIVIAGRLGEIAMMRAIGAGRVQIVRSVLTEALVLGSGAAIVGTGVGVAGGAALTHLASGSFLDTSEVVLAAPASAVIAALAVGIGVTLLSALVPAVRASRVPPVAAMRDAAKADKPITAITVAGAIVSLLGAGLIALGLTESLGDQNLPGVGVGAGLLFVGMTLLTAWLSRPLVNLIGTLWSWNFAGRLGRRNAARNPRRTAVTAAALMIGVALVTATATLLTSVTASLEDYFEDSVEAELFVTGPVTATVPPSFDPNLMDRMRAVDDVDAAVELYYDPAKIDGTEQYVKASSDLAGGLELFGVDMEEGSIADLRDDEIAVSASDAESAGVGIGDTVSIAFTRGETEHEFTVAAILADSDAQRGWFTTPAHTDEFYTTEPTEALIDVADDGDAEAVAAEIEGVIADEPAVTVQNREGYVAQLTVLFDFAIIAIQLLLTLAMIVAVIGVINTLVLSVLERTKELGMLRAIGMTRGQTTRMVTVESVTIALFGALLGIGVGLGLGWVLQRALVDSGVEVFAVPTELILGYMVAAVAVGLLAAIAPAVRASKVNILDAIAYE